MASIVEVRRYLSAEEALCARSFLDAHGIFCVLQNEHHQTVEPWLRFALGGPGLFVPSGQANAARDLLGSFPSQAIYDREEDRPASPSQLLRWLWLPIAFGTMIPYVPRWTGATNRWLLAIGTVVMLPIGFLSLLTRFYALIYSH